MTGDLRSRAASSEATTVEEDVTFYNCQWLCCFHTGIELNDDTRWLELQISSLGHT